MFNMRAYYDTPLPFPTSRLANYEGKVRLVVSILHTICIYIYSGEHIVDTTHTHTHLNTPVANTYTYSIHTNVYYTSTNTYTTHTYTHTYTHTHSRTHASAIKVHTTKVCEPLRTARTQKRCVASILVCGGSPRSV